MIRNLSQSENFLRQNMWFKHGLFARKLNGQQNVQHNENTDEGAQKAKLMSVL